METESIVPQSAHEKPSNYDAFARAAAGLAGLLLLTILVLLLFQEQSGFKVYSRSGVFQFETEQDVSESNDTVRVFTVVKERDFLDGKYPVRGDTILQIGEQPATPELWRSIMQRALPPDTVFTIRVNGPDGIRDFVMQAKVDEPSSIAMLLVIDILRFLIALGFIGVGLWAFFAQPNLVQVRVFAWFCFAMTSVMISGVHIVPAYFATFKVPYFQAVLNGLGVFALGLSVFWLHLQLLFPRPLKFMHKHKRWVVPLIYLPWIVMIVVASLAAMKALDPDIAEMTSKWILLPLLLSLITGFVILSRRFVRTEDRLEKRQLRLVFWGTAIGLGGFVILIAVLNIFSDYFESGTMLQLGSIVASFSLLLLTPISFAYAFGKYRLLEVQGKLRRGTRYLIAAVFAFLVLFAVLYVVGNYTLFGSGAGRSPWSMILVILFALAAGRVSTRLSKILETRFYPERQQLRSRLESALERSTSVGDCDQFWMQLAENIRESLSIQTVHPVLAGINGDNFVLQNLEATPFSPKGDFVIRLHSERRPLLVDELIASGRTQITDDELKWLSGNNVALVLPLMTQQRMTGFLALGFKTEEEDYAPEEISVLTTLAPQVALASENMRLIEENVEKRRLEEQMQMARRIQEGFLPQVLPHTPGLEIATHNRFSLDVAGDYFDVLSLPDGETLIAIADVSGKGAGAALLMANLQASLRMAVDIGIPLTRSIAQVNNLIFRNTPPEQYITFVAVLYDPRTSKLRFVNAGHNPPQLVSVNGHVKELPPTGLILGAIPNMAYEEQSVDFNSGDLLVLYTDGVSEAMNDAEEEYGEERIKQLAIGLRHEPATHIVKEIEIDVERFCGRIPMEDDSTMVIVKRK